MEPGKIVIDDDLPEMWRPENLWVIFPVGGEAKRLKPLTAEVSKACVRFANRPLIEFSLVHLAKQGIRKFIFGVKGYLNYKSLHDYFKEGIEISSRLNIIPRIHIKYQPNVDDVGSADSIRINMEYYDIETPILVVQGDSIFTVDIRDLIRYHLEKRAYMTIVLARVDDVEGFGIAKLAPDGRIETFVEKPRRHEAPSNLANTGIYLCNPEIRNIFKEPEVVRMIGSGRLDFGYDLIPYIIKSGRPVYGYVMKSRWHDVGTPARYLAAMFDVIGGKVEGLEEFEGRVSKDKNLWIEGQSPESIQRREEILEKYRKGIISLEGSVLIGRHCTIGDNTTIANSCIDNYTIIENNVYIENSSIMDRVRIGPGAIIKNSIIGRHVTIKSSPENRTRILSTSVVSDEAVIEEGCTLIGTHVYPHIKTKPNKSYVYTTLYTQDDV
ncbi:MAG: NDP-sugar synthase [Candidatus Nezhaarchaeota archaeon]|nr:NDP-sugar synthase [Candidatus Nezhaarchaeota archaeon]MCX8141680.1 NDP-sugar synthase [Candidatus Nezhaarchaeota archaeon]MDW8049947.1 NDP-sugar synthase [Nitrososphaerota archaeon]